MSSRASATPSRRPHRRASPPTTRHEFDARDRDAARAMLRGGAVRAAGAPWEDGPRFFGTIVANLSTASAGRWPPPRPALAAISDAHDPAGPAPRSILDD